MSRLLLNLEVFLQVLCGWILTIAVRESQPLGLMLYSLYLQTDRYRKDCFCLWMLFDTPLKLFLVCGWNSVCHKTVSWDLSCLHRTLLKNLTWSVTIAVVRVEVAAVYTPCLCQGGVDRRHWHWWFWHGTVSVCLSQETVDRFINQ